mgnify:FL=1
MMLAKAARLDPFAIIKPQRMLGGPWMDDYVALRMSVYLCDTCSAKYANWYPRFNYVKVPGPKFEKQPQKVADCDGCGTKCTYCDGFHPAEKPSQYVIGSAAGWFGDKPIGEFL